MVLSNDNKEIMSTFKLFIEREVANGACAELTSERYLDYAKRYLKFLNKRPIDKESILDYRTHLVARKYKPRTISLHLHIVQRLCKALSNAGMILEDPSRDIKAPPLKLTQEESVVFLSEEELNSVLRISRAMHAQRTTAIIQLMAGQSLRTIEVQRAELADIGEDTLYVHGKGHDRIVHLTQVTIARLREWLQVRPAGGTALFTHLRTSHSLTTRRIRGLVVDVLKRAGVRCKAHGLVRTHSLRHTFATLALANGADIQAVKEAGGWRNLSTVQIYVHAVDRQGRNAALSVPIKE